MYEVTPIKEMSHEDWLKLRKTGIGSSDAAALCGLNPYASAIHVFQDKTSNEIEIKDNESMRQGRDLEDYVAKRFCEAIGFKVRRSHMLYRNKENPFMIANVDRLIVGQDAGLECKTASAYSSDKWKDGQIPPHYLIQCRHYMAVTGKREWYLAVVILGREFLYQKITWDDEVIQKLIAIEKAFWNQHILTGRMPAPDGSKACDELLNQYFHTAKKKSNISLVGFDEKLERREELLQMKEKLEQEQKFYTYDSFHVWSINYDEEGKINSVVIVNQKNEIVYSMDARILNIDTKEAGEKPIAGKIGKKAESKVEHKTEQEMAKRADYDKMAEMVKEINQIEVLPEEILSDSVYLYHSEDDSLCQVAGNGKESAG